MATKRGTTGDTALPLAPDSLAAASEDPRERPSSKADRQEFFLPVTGFAWFYPEEVEVINHPAFQRLGRINQLGQAYLVFRGGTHKRIEHSLGAVGVMQRMISAAQFNAEKSQAKGRTGLSAPLGMAEQRFLRLGALLHDVGHVAAGHTLEDELELIGKHDGDERLDAIFDRDDWGGSSSRGVPSLRELVNVHYRKYVPPELASNGFTATNIVRLLIRKRPSPDQGKYAELQKHLDGSSEIRWHVCSNMIGNTVCADLLDYIYRDWYHIGRPRPLEDRIFQYMEIRRLRGPTISSRPSAPHPEDRFVLSLGERTKIRTDGVSAILGLLEWRYELAETVLFHRTKLAAGAMLDRALYELWEGEDPKQLVNRILSLSDEQLLDTAVEEAIKRKQAGNLRSLEAAVALLQKLRDRAMFKELATFDATNLPDLEIPRIKATYAGLNSPIRHGAKCRAQTARLLENDFRLPPGSIAIYCSHIRPKIAEVSINVDGEISTFSEYENGHRNRLSGGHLEAQIHRFDRLWRIYFFIDAQVKQNLSKERLLLIQEYIKLVVLGPDEPELLFSRAREKALVFVHQENRDGNNRVRFEEEPITFARGDPSVASLGTYPNGAQGIRTFIHNADEDRPTP